MSQLPLETAAHPETLRRVVIEPVSRVEGHGKVTLLMDEDDHVQQARLHIVEFRAFEKFIQGRPYWEVPVMVQRLCGICNAENVHVLREFRANCKILVAMGACAVTGGLPAQRNHLDLGQCLQEVYLTDPGVGQGMIPNDPELPLPLDKVHPLHEVVKSDYFIPGCPPSGDAIWKFLTDLIEGRTPKLGHGLIHYD